MGVFYEVRVHVAEYQDDFKGRKGSSTSMGIRKVKNSASCPVVFFDLSLIIRKFFNQ